MNTRRSYWRLMLVLGLVGGCGSGGAPTSGQTSDGAAGGSSSGGASTSGQMPDGAAAGLSSGGASSGGQVSDGAASDAGQSGAGCDAASGSDGAAVCGNGIIESGEYCDDGNNKSGDGCSASCLVETGWLCSAANQPCRMARQIIMGTGTEWGHWRGQLSIDGTSTLMNYYGILQSSQIPTQLEKTYLNGNTDMSHFQDLLNHGVSPVMLEENQVQGWYHDVYPSGHDWDSSHVWNAQIQAKADSYLADTIAKRVENMKKMNFNGLNMYYVLNPEFVFIGDTKTSSSYAQFVLDEIQMLQSAKLPGLVIVRGFLVNPGDFSSYLGTVQKWAQSHPTELSQVDYFGPEFHNQTQVNSTVASDMVAFLATVKSYTGKQNFIPSSYIRWNTTYAGSATGTDDEAADFWNYLHANRDQLANSAGVVAWCLSATLEDRGGSGLVEPQLRPSGFTGYVYPFGINKTYNRGGIAFINWMRDESPYQIMNVNSQLALKAAPNSAYLVQATPSWQTDQQWVLVQLSNGYSLLQNKQTGLVAGVEDGSTADGALIVQRSYGGEWNSMWAVDDAGNGRYTIKNRKSGRYLSVVDSSTCTGAQLRQQSSGDDSKLWTFNVNMPANSQALTRRSD